MADIDFSLTPRSARNGWAGPELAQKGLDQYGDNLNAFFISAQTEASDKKRVLLWEFTKKVNNGRHLPTITQLVGDCTAQGATNAINYLACVEIAKLNQAEKFEPCFAPYLYGVSRTVFGRGQINLNEDGGTGIWVAEAARRYGVLSTKVDGVPQYSAEISRHWGKHGPPKKFVDVAKIHPIRSIARIMNYTQLRDALANGYPVTVASSRGFRMQPALNRGKMWGIAAGTWMHQVVFVAVDDDQARPGAYLLNSWGPAAHGTPASDEPPGGFWVDADVIDFMTRQGDSYAYSQFDGFPEQQIDFRLI